MTKKMFSRSLATEWNKQREKLLEGDEILEIICYCGFLMKEPRAHLKANGIFSITHYQRNANQSHSQVPSHTGQEGCYQKVYNSKRWGGCGEKGTLLHCWWECKLVQPQWRTVWRFLKKLEIELPYDPAIPLLGKHTEETRIERDTCTPMFITALFIIARSWKQPRCPSAENG